MSTVEAMRENIARLEEAASGAAEHRGSFAMSLALRGLEHVKAQLERDIDTALRPQLDVVIEGAPVHGHEIRIDALSRLLHSLQESVSSVAQALTGEATTRASLPGLLRDRTAFSLAAVSPGSFAATLRGPLEQAAVGQDPLFEEEQQTTLDLAVDAVLDIVEMAARDDPNDDPIVEAVLPLGSRAFKHLRDLSGSIVDQEMTARIEWRHLGREPREVSLSRPVALRLDDVLGRNKMTDRETTITGRLGTVSDIRNRVELQTDADGIIPAKVVEDVVPLLAEFYTKRVQATVRVTTVRSHATGLERNSYVVIGLATLPELPTLLEPLNEHDEG